jgi:hypothetical protein
MQRVSNSCLAALSGNDSYSACGAKGFAESATRTSSPLRMCSCRLTSKLAQDRQPVAVGARCLWDLRYINVCLGVGLKHSHAKGLSPTL